MEKILHKKIQESSDHSFSGLLFPAVRLLPESQVSVHESCSWLLQYDNGLVHVKPDCVSMAKAMGGGMPIGAMCTSAKLALTFGPGAHGSTYAGNPVACAASYAQIGEIIDQKLPENADKIGAYFREELLKLPCAPKMFIPFSSFFFPIWNRATVLSMQTLYTLSPEMHGQRTIKSS